MTSAIAAVTTAEAASEEAGAPAETEIEVTPAMIEAGVDALSSRYLDLEGGLALFPEIVRSVYLRMQESRTG